jgi:membrane protease YdiL (CAAX protease family)
LGFGLLLAGLLLLFFTKSKFRVHFSLIYLCLAILGIAPIDTTTSFPAAFFMGLGLGAVVAIPYLVTRFASKEKVIQFPAFGKGKNNWPLSRWGWLLFVLLVAYLLLPFMLRDTGAYLNWWDLQPDFWKLTEAYIGLNLVGLWDELFFVCTVLALLRQHFPFVVANFAQSVLFTSFLYALAFTGWCFLVIFPFALTQGYIFKATKSLVYILAIHLSIDFILHFALVYLHFPEAFPYFIT